MPFDGMRCWEVDGNGLTLPERRIAELEALLRRIDNVTTWETHPLGRSFQEEIEAALGIGEKQLR